MARNIVGFLMRKELLRRARVVGIIDVDKLGFMLLAQVDLDSKAKGTSATDWCAEGMDRETPKAHGLSVRYAKIGMQVDRA